MICQWEELEGEVLESGMAERGRREYCENSKKAEQNKTTFLLKYFVILIVKVFFFTIISLST
jgi:hypothetical protein